MPKEREDNYPGKDVHSSHLRRDMLDRVQYPDRQDIISLYRNGLVPTVVSGIVSVTGIFGSLLAESKGLITQNQMKILFDLLQNAGIGTVGFGLLLSKLGMDMIGNVQRNDLLMSTLLTVAKTARGSVEGSEDVKAIIKNERFVGVFHFVGDGKTQHAFDNPHAIRRDGFRGLYNLARGCETNYPPLKDISYFIGVSSLVSKQLEPLGWQVFPIDTYGTIYRRVTNGSLQLQMEYCAPSSQVTPYRNRPAMIGIISREELIKHKHIYRRLSEKR